MSTEYDIASAVARDGLNALKGVLETIKSYEKPVQVKYTRELTEVVKAASLVMKEEREQLAFEEKAELSPEDIQAALKAHLSQMTQSEFRALVQAARPEFASVLGESGVSPSAAHV